MNKYLLFLTCIALSGAYMIDQNNYFYINSSFSRQVASISMCFHFDQPTTIKLESQLLGSKENPTIVADFNDEKGAKFSPPFNSDIVGYNNYDNGEYWFGAKFEQKDNSKQDTFQKLKMTIQIGQKQYVYVFLSPLFKLMLNAFEVSPVNVLYSYSDWLLISYHYRESEVDAYFFQKKNMGNYKILQEFDWGFKREDINVNYERHKSKKHRKLTLEIRSPTSKQKITLDPNALPDNSALLPEQPYNFRLEDLLQIAIPIGLEPSEL